MRSTECSGPHPSELRAHSIIGNILVGLGFLAFLVSLVSTLGLANAINLFVPKRSLQKGQPAAA